MTVVYFVRHAEPNYENHDDFLRELTPKGLQDRSRVTAYLADKGIDAVVSSPYVRAVDTVKELADRLGLAVQTVDDFRERKIDDTWIGDFTAFSKQQWADFSYKLGGGESLAQVQRRNIAALERILGQFAGKTIVIGSHGTALSTVLNYYDPSFGYAEFEAIRPIMPWMVKLTFNGLALVGKEAVTI